MNSWVCWSRPALFGQWTGIECVLYRSRCIIFILTVLPLVLFYLSWGLLVTTEQLSFDFHRFKRTFVCFKVGNCIFKLIKSYIFAWELMRFWSACERIAQCASSLHSTADICEHVKTSGLLNNTLDLLCQPRLHCYGHWLYTYLMFVYCACIILIYLHIYLHWAGLRFS